MGYNLIIDSTLTEVAYEMEPVTVDECKAYCRVEVDNDAQDELFLLWRTSARTMVEELTGLSLVPKSCVAKLQNPQGTIEIPFGPVTGTITWLDRNGSVPTVVTEGDQFPRVCAPFDYVQATYLCGYTNDTIPRALKVAILVIVNGWYENRGDESMKIPAAASVICQKYSRIGILG